ncbi:uncharacterized protein LOC122046702 isoform X2 [Zingiber officinale]|uniref:Uncharacterized protein n=2 Tax=Zingiber officinale TaxID=94328 RepID=A0A8J5IB71_ZINOF|nr:uncharacterized protein LOC122046702 isoform X2 [Zingiber officinale]KAG6530914.1 hypothetical protein ZIOFF_004681 [Zingiber officinale]
MAAAAKISRAVIRRPSGFSKLSTTRRRLSSKSPAKDKRAKRIELSRKLDSFFTPEKKKKSSETSKKGRLKTVGSDSEDKGLTGSSKVNALRRSMLEEAMNSLPAHGAGRVMYMVKTFERLQSVVMMAEYVDGEETRKVKNWALPGLECRPEAKLSDFSPSPVSCSAECLAEEGTLTEHSSVKNKDRRFSSGSNESCKVQRNDQNSKVPSKRRNDRLKAKSPLPFKLSAKVSKHISFLEKIKQERDRLMKKRNKKTS